MFIRRKHGISGVSAILVVLVLVFAATTFYFGYFGVSSGKTTTVTGSGTTVTIPGTTQTTSLLAPINQTLASQCQASGGALTIYGVMDTSDWPTMNAVLVNSFPWINVNYVGLNPSDIPTKGIAEYQAGHVTADVFLDGYGEIVQLNNAGAIQPYQNFVEHFENYTPSQLDPTGVRHPSQILPTVIVYNTNLVTDNSTLPKTYADLANPIWKGKIAMDKPALLNVAGPWLASLFAGEFHGDNASFTNFINALAANNPIYTASGGDSFTAVASGDAVIGVTLLNQYLGLFGGGAPGSTPTAIDWLPTTYTLADQGGLAKNAPHTLCGEFFLQWWASSLGQYSLSLTGRIPQLQPIADKMLAQYTKYVPPGITTYVPDGTGTDLYSNQPAWANLFTSVFGS